MKGKNSWKSGDRNDEWIQKKLEKQNSNKTFVVLNQALLLVAAVQKKLVFL